MNVKIYIHGRPQGGDMWSGDDIDSIDESYYIRPFLDFDIGRNVDSLMIADRWHGSSYYTYFRHKGLMENDPRRGTNAYFAITVKLVGTYCQKVSLLYSLLDRVFEVKVFGKGKIIEPYGGDGLQRFSIGNLNEKESVLTEIASAIKTNLEQVVAPYISALPQQADTKDSVPVQYSLEEVDSPKFEKDSEQHRIIVSAQYQSLEQRVASLEKEKGSIAAQLGQASQQANEYKQQLQNLQAEKQKAKKEKQTREEREAARKADTDYQDFNRVRRDFQDYQRQKGDYTDFKSQKESFSIFQQYKDTLFAFSRRMAGTFPVVGTGASNGGGEDTKKGHKKGISRTWLLWTVLIVVLIFSTVTNIIVLCHICDKGNCGNSPVTPPDTAIVQKPANPTEADSDTSGQTGNDKQICTIDIDGFHQKKNDLYLQKRFTLSAIKYNGNVRWSCTPNGRIEGNVLVPIAVGSITIHGEADGVIIKDRTVTAVKRPSQSGGTQPTDIIKK